MKSFAKISALLGLAALFTTTAVFGQAPAAAPKAAKPPVTAVKGYTKKTKSGKVITVKGYNRKATGKKAAPKTTAVKGYTKTTKSGKVITVKGYNRKVTAKKIAAPKKK